MRLIRAGKEVPPELQPDDPVDESAEEAKMRRDVSPEDKMRRPALDGGEDKAVETVEEGQPEQSGGLDEVPFGSSAAERLAEEEGLAAEDFEDEEPSGVQGYVKGDVERIAGVKRG